ncbi:MAG: hypothetical protein V4529_17370 [Gemmatimonadota bacterium]
MHTKSTAAALAGQPPLDLVLERLPSGELAWLRPSTAPAEDDEARYWPSERGRQLTRRWAAERWLFGREICS